jgi:hypothetical protein
VKAISTPGAYSLVRALDVRFGTFSAVGSVHFQPVANTLRAVLKRTGNQCRAPAMHGKKVCRFHGGKSTGPRTQAGLERCAAAKTIHGQDTRAMRKEHRAALVRIKELEDLARRLGLFRPKLSLRR